MLEDIGLLVLAQALATLTAGMIAWASKTLLQVSRMHKNLDYRVNRNEDAIDQLKEKL